MNMTVGERENRTREKVQEVGKILNNTTDSIGNESTHEI
jgi:hypothetical protein